MYITFKKLHFNTFRIHVKHVPDVEHVTFTDLDKPCFTFSDLCLRESSPCRNVAVGIGFGRWRRQATNRLGQQPNCPRAYFRRPWNETQNRQQTTNQRTKHKQYMTMTIIPTNATAVTVEAKELHHKNVFHTLPR